jgi:hypothetical protein
MPKGSIKWEFFSEDLENCMNAARMPVYNDGGTCVGYLVRTLAWDDTNLTASICYVPVGSWTLQED